jgi:hypothetical protein
VDFVHPLEFKILENIMFPKLDLFPSSGERREKPTLFGSLETGQLMKLKLKLICDRQTVGQSVLVSGAHLGPVTDFSFSLKFPLDSCVFVLYCTVFVL